MKDQVLIDRDKLQKLENENVKLRAVENLIDNGKFLVIDGSVRNHVHVVGYGSVDVVSDIRIVGKKNILNDIKKCVYSEVETEFIKETDILTAEISRLKAELNKPLWKKILKID